jgi:isoleucyl-tRNA synthetase
MAFGPVDPQLDLVALEERVLSRWRELDLAEVVLHLRDGAPPWVFYEGPPTANGRPGLHHVWARVFKDLFPRFQTMRGHDVPRKGGWDCHGLPVEIEVEKELGFTNKSQIEAYGIDKFNARCRESVQRYVGDWEALTERAGVWIDTKDAYWTLSNDYVESVWWLLKQLYDKGLLYEGHRVIPYCSRCGTALSSHELGQPGAYRDVTDPSVYVRFPVVDRDFDLLVWTTTPWTLISNVAAAVGPEITYVRVHDGEDGGHDLVMAEALAPDGAEVIERFAGSEMVGWRYRRPFDLLPIDDRGQRVVGAAFVSTEDGSGIVHLAPAFGADDMEAARADDLPVLNPVGPDGTFGPDVAPWAGVWVKDADRSIIEDLAARGLLVREQAYTHSYPHCWRCGTPLIYWAKTSWFVRTSHHRSDLLRENEHINWYPDHIKHGRFGDWLENNVDWALSRDRYWGTPLPIWRCENGHDTCVGGVEELSRLVGRDLAGLDLHRPAVDDVVFPCPTPGCGASCARVAPVLDAWFDSGSMPSAQHHYPFGDRAEFQKAFPADFICEAIDQTRGWFYSLLAVNTLVFGSTPYRNVVCLAHVVDEFGAKMSKSKGNVLDPWHVFDTFGADAVRWYFFSAGSPWSNRRVYEDGIREATRKTLITLWNVFAFFATYADLAGWEAALDGGDGPGAPATSDGDWDPADADADSGHVLDRWAEARLAQTVAAVTDALDDFDALGGATTLATFVDDLSNWYVRRSRPRFWGPAGGASDAAAFATLYRCLTVVSQLLAPFCPFLADELYVTMTGETSVHVQRWPDLPDPDVAAVRLLADVDAARRLVGLGRSARTDAGIRTRQPLPRALVLHPGVVLSPEVRAQVADELNVKAIEDVETLSDLMSWTVIPNFRALGPRLGPRVNAVKAALAEADGSEIRRRLEADGFVDVAGERLEAGDVEVRANRHEDFALATDDDWAVALDLALDEELELEGVARQLARDINDLRRARGLSLSDRIEVVVESADEYESITASAGAPRGAHEASPRLPAVLAAHGEWIAGQVLATSLSSGPASPDAATYPSDGGSVRVDLRVVAPPA